MIYLSNVSKYLRSSWHMTWIKISQCPKSWTLSTDLWSPQPEVRSSFTLFKDLTIWPCPVSGQDERVGPRRQIVVSTRPLSQCPHNDVFTAIIYNKYFYFEPGRGCCPLFSSPGLSVVCRDLTQFVWSSREQQLAVSSGVKIPACPRSFVINSHNCGSDTHKADAQIINNYVSNVRLLQTFCF